MLQLDAFIEHGHRKIIDHYRWLRDTAASEAERERFQQRMVEEYEALRRDQQPRDIERAA